MALIISKKRKLRNKMADGGLDEKRIADYGSLV